MHTCFHMCSIHKAFSVPVFGLHNERIRTKKPLKKGNFISPFSHSIIIQYLYLYSYNQCINNGLPGSMSRVTGEVVVRHRYLVLLDQLLKKKAVLDQLMAGNCPSGLQGEEVALIWLRLT